MNSLEHAGHLGHAPVSSSGLITPLRVTSELIAVKKEPIPAERFEVPAGFKKAAKE